MRFDELLERDLARVARDEASCAILPLRLSAISCAFFASLTACIGSPALGDVGRGRGSRPASTGRLRGRCLPCSFGHRADLAEAGACEDEVADAQRAVLDEDARHRAATAIEEGLEDGAAGGLLRVRLELEDLGLEGDASRAAASMPSPVCAETFDEDRVAAPLFGLEAELDELALDALGLGARLVDLVDRDDDRHLRRLGVGDGFLRLRHDAVVGGDDEDDDVGHAGAAGAHLREGLVARRVEERRSCRVGVCTW